MRYAILIAMQFAYSYKLLSLAEATGRRYPSAMSARAFAMLLLMALIMASIAVGIAAAENGGRVLVPLVVVPRPEWCDASYPTICFPSAPDLDCPEVLPHQNFPVLPPDPHGFDADSDGIGCEFP